MTLDFLNGLYGKGASTSPTDNMASSTPSTSLASPAITPTTASSTPTTPPATQPTTPQMPKINGALSPTLNDKQIRENIDYMLGKGIPKEQVQAYVNNYKKGSDGNYVLKTPTPPATQPQDVYSKDADAFNKGGQELVSNIERPSEIADAGGSPLEVGGAVAEAGLRTAGTVAGTTLKMISDSLAPYVPNFVKNFLAGDSSTDKNANPYLAEHVKMGLDTLNSLVQKYPEAMKDIDATGNIAALVGLGKTPGLDTPISEVPRALKTGASDIAGGITNGLSKNASQKVTQNVWDTIKPNLTPTEQAQAVTEGKIGTKGILNTVTQIPKGNDLDMIKAATPYVTDAKNPIEAVANMQGGIADKATALRTGLNDTGAIYNKSQVVGALNKIEMPTMIASDNTLKNAYNLVKQKMVSLVGDGGKLGDLLNHRSEFDSFINQQFPNLYSSDTLTPMRKAVLDIRGAINKVVEDGLPDGKLPDGTDFRDSLKQQTLLYNAIDNTAPKVGKMGSNAITQWIKANPNKATALKWLIGGVGAAEVGKNVLGL